MDKWEYYIVCLGEYKHDYTGSYKPSDLDKYGRDGWEAVSVFVPVPNYSEYRGWPFVPLKRRLP